MSADEEKKKKDEAKEKKTARKRQTKAAKSQKAKKPAKRSRSKKTTAGTNGGDTTEKAKTAEEIAVPVSESSQEQELAASQEKPKRGRKKAKAKSSKATNPDSSNGSKVSVRTEVSIQQSEMQPTAPLEQENIKIEDVVKFTLAGQLYGLLAQQVVEVLRMVAFTVLPVQPKGMLGVINFRGEVIPLLDLRRVIDLPAQHITLSTPIIVVRAGSRLLSVVVDEVLEVEAVPLSSRTQADEVSTDVRYVAAVARVEEGLLLIIDLEDMQQLLPNTASKIAAS
jgi:purine-binding chemotaxis protein CheW